jgi:Cu(I)/Ag(I) efflux system protein CusF
MSLSNPVPEIPMRLEVPALLAAALVPTALLAFPAHAQHSHMHGMHGNASGHEAMPVRATEGVVQKVDREAGKITLRHGEIPSMGMPAMTMVFKVKEPVLLEKVKAGDSVRFTAMNDAGAMVLTAIDPVN